jgi:hypothetical protein
MSNDNNVSLVAVGIALAQEAQVAQVGIALVQEAQVIIVQTWLSWSLLT